MRLSVSRDAGAVRTDSAWSGDPTPTMRIPNHNGEAEIHPPGSQKLPLSLSLCLARMPRGLDSSTMVHALWEVSVEMWELFLVSKFSVFIPQSLSPCLLRACCAWQLLSGSASSAPYSPAEDPRRRGKPTVDATVSGSLCTPPPGAHFSLVSFHSVFGRTFKT